MRGENLQSPDYLFEVSWEVCNKVGGIHTVVSTKAINMDKEIKNHIMIGPDVLHDSRNVEFMEDIQLHRAWRQKMAEEGVRVRVGRWKIAGEPIAILVDYTTFIPQKDKIFSEFWESYKLDSITGQWDYVEPTLFGYATGRVIESFLRFNVTPRHKVAAIFHEWMTGAGLLYLKSNVPQVGTMFTTHATVMGRCIAGNGQPLYDNIERYNADIKAREFNVTAKQSLEKCAAQHADCFTTVSDITAKECKYFLGKEVDLVTPNGFENDFVPNEEKFVTVQKEARDKFIEVAEALLCEKADPKAMIIGTGGRYEFKNKGVDVFIESLAKLNRNANLKRPVYAFIMVPAGHHGPRRDVLFNLENKGNMQPLQEKYTTHQLTDPQYDPAINLARKLGLNNGTDDRVKLFFCPSYLNGSDGIFNRCYYDMLIGLDASVFPSYYEPWGYTPMESVAFKVPTITTTLAGFGLWVNTHYQSAHEGIEVVERNDSNDEQVVFSIVKKLLSLAALSAKDFEGVRENAKHVSTIALWDNLAYYYFKAFDVALEKVAGRIDQVLSQSREEPIAFVGKNSHTNQPTWNRIMVDKNIPEKLKPLESLSRNLWWCWNQDAVELFKSIDKTLWAAADYNPIAFLDKIPFQRYQALEKDEVFLKHMREVYAKFEEYMNAKSLRFANHLGADKKTASKKKTKLVEAESSTGSVAPYAVKKKGEKEYKIAYFSMEFGLHTSLKIYSGGLGILAGDYLKEASDKGTPMVGVGLLYRYGYFTQKFSAAGDQVAQYDEQDFMKIPVSPVRDDNGVWQTVSVAMPGRTVKARIWRCDVGRTELYLLDTDFEDNLPEDRTITHQLYGGDWENRLKQELVLGVGGIRALRVLGVDADVYHCNEGHAAFIGLERIREYVNQKSLTYAEALEVVRTSSLFTTHTPVPAGHDAFDEGMLRTYISHYPQRLKTTWEELMKLGKLNPNDVHEKFSMSYLACGCSQEVNGVSWLHGEVSREILKGMWPGYYPEELHIGYVTNGVHHDTWTAAAWKEIQSKAFGPAFDSHHYDKSCFKGIYEVPDEKIWATRNLMRGKLMRYIRERLGQEKKNSFYTPSQLVEISETIREDILTIGFARRFATYKRAHLLFKNMDRLNAIVNNPEMPVQFIFAGKAHPADKAGQDLIKRIIEISKYPQFLGKIVFLENYDIRVARKMVQGVDVWMNTPTRPLEASGTSGEKAVMNGVMNLSVLDGWWVEGYRENAGWALPMERSYQNHDFQDELDAETIYGLIENEIAPQFYKREKKGGLPVQWIQAIKNTIAEVASDYTTNRMLQDYEDRFYDKLANRHIVMVQNSYQLAKDIAEWKRKMSRLWDSIEVISKSQFDLAKEQILLGKSYELEVQLDIASLDPEDVGVELVIADQEGEKMSIKNKINYTCTQHKGNMATYTVTFTAERPGIYFAGVRLYAKNPRLPHRQDFPLLRWI
ncbi:MAG: alpha-glucan family phosphorylase [Prevotellaceae bacterium]|jgi:phosphorylase/glycogen(starch) synthase|nr:alpha-glucan family phosphorylase [Prevotellaceae bacterium]